MELLHLLHRASHTPLEPQECVQLSSLLAGLETTLGLAVTAAGPGGVTAELPVGPAVLQPFGLVHGGLYPAIAESLASMAALIAGFAALTPADESATELDSKEAEEPATRPTIPALQVVGVSNHTEFIKPAHNGDTVVSTAEVIHSGRSTSVVEVTHRNQADELLARSTVRTLNSVAK